MAKTLRLRTTRRGFSIPEIVVAIVFGSMLLATAVGLAWVFGDTSRVVIGATNAQATADLALAQIRSDVSAAVTCDPYGLGLPTAHVSENELVVATSDGTDTQMVRYLVTGDTITRSVATNSCTSPSWTSSTTVLVSDPGLEVDFSLVGANTSGPVEPHPGDCYTPSEAVTCRDGSPTLAVTATVTVPTGPGLEPTTVAATVPVSLSSSALPW